MRVAVLALQGDFAEHVAVLRFLGVTGFEARNRDDVNEADALIIPGGESTTIIKLIDRFELRELLVKKIVDGMPVLGTCAGAIVLANRVSDGEPPLGVLDVTIQRNAYGRQVESFEAKVATAFGDVAGAFIRAPIITGVGKDVTVVASFNDDPVIVRQGCMVAATFHPEIVGATGLHGWFLDEVCR